MRARFAMVIAALACACGTFGTILVASPAATAAIPNICKTECGGQWGAKEHAKWYAENRHSLYDVNIEGCTLNSEYSAQWVCWGTGLDDSSKQLWHFHVWIGEKGAEKNWVWELY